MDQICPITHERFVEPVVAEDGNVYERTAIEDWFAKSKENGLIVFSPISRQPMGTKLLVCRWIYQALGLSYAHKQQNGGNAVAKKLPSIFTKLEDVLLELEVDPHDENRYHLNAWLLHYAYTNFAINVAFEGKIEDSLDAHTLTTALSFAIYRNHHKAFRTILAIGRTVLERSADHFFPVLMDAITCGNLQAFELLTEHSRSEDSAFALMYQTAARNDQSEIMMALASWRKSWGADGDAMKFIRQQYYDAIHLALQDRDIAMFDCLLHMSDHLDASHDWQPIIRDMDRLTCRVDEKGVHCRREFLKEKISG